MLPDRELTRISKFLSLVLRHKPEKIGITLDASGWTDLNGLLVAMARHGRKVTRDELQYVVQTNNKKRFSISDDGKRIRANQGHSVKVDLGYEKKTPPTTLMHGTVSKFLPAIKTEGILKGSRHAVHLSDDEGTAKNVGSRRGRPIVLVIKAKEMHEKGHDFFLSENGVWLTEHVPPEFIDFSSTEWGDR